jgi:DNA polymerase III delta prime subunit
MRSVIVLNGPIGVGKTTLGRALARELGGAFIDSDDLRDPSKRWLDQVLSLTNALVRTGMEVLASRPVLVVAMPLRARDWALLRARFRAEEVAAFCVTLAADEGAILAPARGRAFSTAERNRITEMIAQGYAARPFSDLVVRTDRADFAETLSQLREGCRPLLRRVSP